MKKVVGPLVVLLLLFSVSLFLWQSEFLTIGEKGNEISEPLLRLGFSEESILTKNGVLNWTNIQRANNSLSPLRENPILNEAASSRLSDMVEKQYFDHVSPLGEDASSSANIVGYSFIAIGENLAMGGFKDDYDLVDGWMKSPGHRANILNPGYTEIGIAVERVIFEERETWLAVQLFALPSFACPKADDNLLVLIEAREGESSVLHSEIIKLRGEVDDASFRNRQSLVARYNSLVSQYNNLISELRQLIETYNKQIQELNNCISAYGF